MNLHISRNRILTLIALVAFFLLLAYASSNFSPYVLRIMNLSAIYVIFAVTFNLIYGYTGQFSLGHAGFAAVGAYVAALLTMSPDQKVANFFLQPIVPLLANVQLPFLAALVIAGLMTAIFSFVAGWPSFRLRGDYLAIATLGLSEIIRVLLINLQSVTNGALGLKGIPGYTNLFWSWGFAVVTIFVVKRLVDSSYGRALMALRDDDVAAEALGVSLLYHKMLALMLSSFFVGIGGGLLANLISTIDPSVFLFFLSYQIVGITVMGGMASLTGSVVAACLYTVFLELLRPIESPFSIGSLDVPGMPGMRMVLFSALLLLVILFSHRGLFGGREFGWDWILDGFDALRKRLKGSKERTGADIDSEEAS
ncbi:MAG: branched-chain amino acid ABC transporter permease [Anaerolineae bacterium]